MNKSQILDFIAFYKMSQLLWNWGCMNTRDVHLMTEADTIRISMHSQRYDTLKIHMKQVPMRCDTIHPITMQCDPISIQFNTMRFDAIQCMEITFNDSRHVS